MRTYKEIVKNYILIYLKSPGFLARILTRDDTIFQKPPSLTLADMTDAV